MDETKRKEIINHLENIGFCCTPTVVTPDMGLEYDYASSKGAGTGFGGMGSWPAHIIERIELNRWLLIRTKLENSEVTLEDLVGTSLFGFAKDILDHYYGALFRNISLSDMFSGLLSVDNAFVNDMYCLFDFADSGYDGHRPIFYANEAEFLEDFEGWYCYDNFQSWDELSDEDLLEWYWRITTGDLSEFNYYVYSAKNGDETE